MPDQCITPPGAATKVTYIYALSDPRTGDVRYVGKSDRPRNRLRLHLTDKNVNHRTCWLTQLRRDGVSPALHILECVPAAIWQERERWWIAYHRERGCELTNSTEGGDGFDLTPEAQAKHNEALAALRKTPEYKVVAREAWNRPGRREAVSAAIAAQWADPQVRAARLSAQRAAGSTAEFREKSSVNARAYFADEQARTRVAEQAAERWANPEYKERVGKAIAASFSDEWRAARSEAMKARWADPEFRARRSAAVREGRRRGRAGNDR